MRGMGKCGLSVQCTMSQFERLDSVLSVLSVLSVHEEKLALFYDIERLPFPAAYVDQLHFEV